MSFLKIGFASSIFLLIVTAGGVWPLALGGVIFYMINLLLLVCIFIWSKTIRLNLTYRTAFLSVIIMGILIILQIINTRVIFDGEFPKFLFRVFIAIFTLYLYGNNERNIKDDLFFVLKLIALHAILNFAFGFVISNYLSDFEVDGMIKIKTFYQLFFYESKVELGSLTILRNQSFFWEPGVLSVFMNILLYLCLFEYKKKTESLIAIFLILTTFSTTGLILILIQLLFLMKDWIKKNFLMIIPSVVVLCILMPIFISNFAQKFSNDNDSYLLRVYDYTIAFQILSGNILTGIGFGNDVYLNAQYSYSIFQNSFLTEPRGNSNSIVSLFIAFGSFFGLYILYRLYHQSIFNYKGLFFLIISICLMSEPLIFTSFFMVIVFSGLLNSENTQTIETAL